MAMRSSLVPRQNSSLSIRPAGPDMKTVRAPPITLANFSTDPLPMSSTGPHGRSPISTSRRSPPTSTPTSKGRRILSPLSLSSFLACSTASGVSSASSSFMLSFPRL